VVRIRLRRKAKNLAILAFGKKLGKVGKLIGGSDLDPCGISGKNPTARFHLTKPATLDSLTQRRPPCLTPGEGASGRFAPNGFGASDRCTRDQGVHLLL
jgi:hypothetical protein